MTIWRPNLQPSQRPYRLKNRKTGITFTLKKNFLLVLYLTTFFNKTTFKGRKLSPKPAGLAIQKSKKYLYLWTTYWSTKNSSKGQGKVKFGVQADTFDSPGFICKPTASVIQSLLKSAPDFVKRLSLLFFFYPKTLCYCKKNRCKVYNFQKLTITININQTFLFTLRSVNKKLFPSLSFYLIDFSKACIKKFDLYLL